MPDNRAPIRRIHHEASKIAELNTSLREQIAKALEILKTAVPDTFLGRKTYEPFPSEEERQR